MEFHGGTEFNPAKISTVAISSQIAAAESSAHPKSSLRDMLFFLCFVVFEYKAITAIRCFGTG